jgi:hypothetical protein
VGVQTPHSKIAGGDALESHDEMLFIVVHQVGLDPAIPNKPKRTSRSASLRSVCPQSESGVLSGVRAMVQAIDPHA